MKRLAFLFSFVLLAPLALAQTVRPEPMEIPRDATGSRTGINNAFKAGHNALLRERWHAAYNGLSQFEVRYPSDELADDAGFWACYARERAHRNELEENFACYKGFVAVHPQSRWADEAKAGMVRLATELTRTGKTEYEREVQALKNDQADEQVTLSALYALSEFDDAESVAAVLDVYERAASPRLREGAVQVLVRMEAPDLDALLLKIAQEDDHVNVRRAAAWELAREGNDTAVTFFKAMAIEDDDAQMRQFAVEALSKIGTARAKRALIEVLRQG